MNCRHCHEPLVHTFLDLGFAPPSNAYLSEGDLNEPEVYYPLKVKVCDSCWLVQTEDYAEADALFTPEYAYFSSTSASWLDHAKSYSDQIIRKLGLNSESFVIEVASNDGYLLKHIVQAGIPCLGIEPTDSTAAVAEQLGIPVRREFFGTALGNRLADEGKQANLIVGNNVYAHVPDINDFTRGLKAALKPGGTITLEFPHLIRLIEQAQFDTVYHEHFSYLSLYTVNRIFAFVGLRIWNVEELPTHGGSLRIYGCHHDDERQTQQSVKTLLEWESLQGLQTLDTYLEFQSRANKVKNDLVAFLIEQKRENKKVVAYGAAAKGNTLLNYAGVKPDLLALVFDASPSKQGRFMPGSHIRILPPDRLAQEKPHYVLILPWNISGEVMEEQSRIRDWGGRFIVAIPRLRLLD
jgi:SAM-dependent methyltransferase